MEGHRSSGPETGEHQGAGRRHGQSPRLRSRQSAGERAAFERCSTVADHHQPGDDTHRRHCGYRCLHESGAGTRPASGQTRRHLGLRLRPLRDADRSTGLSGDEVTDVRASILARDPDWTMLPRGLSPVLGTFVKHCLDKDRKRRIGDIQSVQLALKGAFEPAEPIGSSSRRAQLWPWGIAAALTILLLLAIWAAAPPRQRRRHRSASTSAAARARSLT